MKKIEYGMKTTTGLGFDEALERTAGALKSHGFGVLTRIDVQATLKEKIGADFKRYVILGACNPNLAHEALQAEPDLGLLLPCNVIVYEDGEGSVVAAMDPDLMAGVTGNEALSGIAARARASLAEALAEIGAD